MKQNYQRTVTTVAVSILTAKLLRSDLSTWIQVLPTLVGIVYMILLYRRSGSRRDKTYNAITLGVLCFLLAVVVIIREVL
ncbi:hypothetical protein O6R05_06630 [Peptoniphilus equinus]|uniref:Uncharacterized protein n=1 Tax=Peptoniphilus equinus TaxID=3016343 RepID=A0ABY7QS89_9FIRM|nr:hypothetical protein [Peptoniphilus equinus]WBW49671.1 hypothetical protein O6R05_06630 [Peptoniphilus equinus]